MKILILATTLFFSFNSMAQINFNEFLEVKEAVQKAFLELRPSSDHELTINQPIPNMPNFWWENETPHASYSQSEKDGKTIHNIFLFGGFARFPGMTMDGLVVTACHEIGHGIGGDPKKTSGSTTEGQSDYYATQVCLPVVLKYLKTSGQVSSDPYIKDLCSRNSHIDLNYCHRAMTALESDIVFFREAVKEEASFDGASTHIATSIDHSPSFYPDAQCRLDTMIHGVLQLERPRCWFPEGIARKL